MERIYLCLAHMSGKEMDFIKEAFDTNWVVPMGPNVTGFEHDLENFVNEVKSEGSRVKSQELNKKVVCLSAGTAAVHLALIACGVEAGGEVVVQSVTF
ncbi:MAG: DegT/DnrJ/EryC1/StrS family aminotransferase, partial [Muribaculaceae bacterium]|nr:DegT/DnrJ/EryC1/StrS family aminotransferase [Muribaculaceae bacterium]